MRTRAIVVSVGARTPIGLDVAATAALYRTGTIVMQAGPFQDGDGEPVSMCVLPTIDPRLTGSLRATELAVPALAEAIAPLAGAGLRMKLLMCVDELAGERVGGARMPATELLATLTRRLGAVATQLDVDVVARGPAALGWALERVLDEVERGSIGAAVIGGVHTDYDPERIRALWETRRLLSGDQLDAITPGEGAAFAVLTRPQAARSLGLRPLVNLHAHATAVDQIRADNDAPAFVAQALTAVVRKAGEPLSEEGLRAGWLLTDLSFETMRLYELQAMATRTQSLWCEPQLWDAPAQRLGYLGAATMPLHFCLAAEAWRRGWGPHPIAVSLAGSDGGERAAMLLSAPAGS